MKVTMSWADRFALIDHYQPSDEAILKTFSLTPDELSTVRQMRAAGTFAANPNLDVVKYANVFSNTTTPTVVATSSSTVSPKNKGTTTVYTKPETASKKLKEPQKRGRKGDKIQTALTSVPTTPVPVETFMSQHGVSLAVLRQSKRFLEKLDAATQATIGKINVRQDKVSKTLMIWREQQS